MPIGSWDRWVGECDVSLADGPGFLCFKAVACVLIFTRQLTSLQVLGAANTLPDIFFQIDINFFLLRRLIGVRTEGDKKAAKVAKLTKGEVLMVNIGSLSTGRLPRHLSVYFVAGGRVANVKNDAAQITLNQPVCTERGEKIALSRRIDKHWRLIGWGTITKGKVADVLAPNAAGADD